MNDGCARPGRSGARFDLALLTVLLWSCGGDRLPAPDIVAAIDRSEIPFAEFEVYLTRNSADPDAALGSDVLSALFDEFLNEELVRRLAVDEGVVDPGTGSREAASALFGRQSATVSEAQIAAYYAEHREDFELPERVRLSQILVEERARAEEALQAVSAGTPFAEAARLFSQDPAAQRGGDQGVLSREDLPPAFAETIFGLDAGEVSGLVEAEYGFHIFHVVERRPHEVLALDEAEREIRYRLERRSAETLLEELVAQAGERYNTRVFGRNLPFNYQGRYATDNTNTGG